jgi:anti-sigma factor RsiW
VTAGTCAVARARIDAALDGELDAAACAAIDAHCATCPACAAVVAGLRETVGLCREAGAAPLPDEVRERARQRVRQLLEQGRRSG